MWIRKLFARILGYFKNIFLTVLVICLVVGFSFLIRGKFSFLAYSERLFYAGIAVILLGGMVGFAVMFSGRAFGIPMIIRRPAEAKKLLDNFEQYREEIEKRYDASILIWLVGIACVAVSALVEIFLV